MQQIPSLTGVRGVAAIWVFAYHISIFAPYLGLPGLADLPIARFGWIGVDLFFVLSGFILMMVHAEDFLRFDGKNYLRFLTLRFFRIYPLTTVVLIIVMVLLGFNIPFWRSLKLEAPLDYTVTALVRTLFLTTRLYPPFIGGWNPPVWSVSAELIGYAFFPLIAVFASRIRSIFIMSILCLLPFIIYSLIFILRHKEQNNYTQIYGVVRMATEFSAGIFFCRLRQLLPEVTTLNYSFLSDLAAIVLLIGVILPQMRTIVAPTFALLVFGLSIGPTFISRLLSLRWVVFLGRISFPFYLISVFSIRLLIYLNAGGGFQSVINLTAMVIACFAVAALLHYLVERPSHKCGRSVAHYIGGKFTGAQGQPSSMR